MRDLSQRLVSIVVSLSVKLCRYTVRQRIAKPRGRFGMEFNIINDTGTTAYFQLGLGTFDVTNSGGTIVQGDSVAIAPLGTQTVDITEAINAKLLLSLGTALASDAPSPSNSSLTDYNTLWDKVELNLFGTADTIDQSAINLSSTDFYGLDLEVQTFTSATPTVAAQTLGWTQDTPQLLGSLAALTNYNTSAVMVGAGGVPVVEPGGETIDVLRVIAPSTIGGPAADNPYPSFQPYVDSVEANGISTTVEGTYSHTGSTAATMTQGYSFVATIPSMGSLMGDLVMIGGGFVIPAGSTSVGPGHTIIVLGTDVADGIYTANPPFTVDGTAEVIANNDVYAAAVRDMLGGFDLGFVGSTTKDAMTGVEFVDEPTSDWYAVNNGTAVNGPLAFGNAQPTNPTFYDQYAGLIAHYSNSYGAPFSDLLPGPQANIDPNTFDQVNITITADAVSCFATGTPIMTEAGEVRIECLAVGALLPTRVVRRLAQVIWIGHRTVDCRRHPRPRDVLPVRIMHDALGAGVPHCDVLLSPDHALLVDDVLIPVRYLLNGTTIVQEDVDQVDYWHIELDCHDVILAGGLPAESFLDTGNRMMFANAGAVISAHPEFGRWVWEGAGCAPLVVGGDKLAKARELVAANTGRASVPARACSSR
jgi:hypothetical protein